LNKVDDAMKVWLAIRAMLLLGLVVPCHGAERWVWDSERGWVQPESVDRTTLQGRYDHAVALMVSEQFGSAAREFELIADEFPDSELAMPARIRQVECLYRMGLFWEAFKIAESYMPMANEEQRKQLVALEYAMGKAALERNSARAPTILDWVIKHDPGGEYADDAQFDIAMYYRKRGRYEEARKAFDAVCDRYPRSKYVPEATFESALCCLVMSRKEEQRERMLREARRRFEAYVKMSPRSGKALIARKHLKTISGIEMAASPVVVDFYYGLLLFSEGRYEEALPRFKRAAKRMRGAETGEEAQYHYAECLYRLEKYDEAFKEFERLFKWYPATKYTMEAAKREYRIACDKMVTDAGKAAKMFTKVAERAPHADFADDAIFKMGECYIRLRNYARAREAYRMLREGYKDSEWVGAALVQEGRCDLEEAKIVNAGVSLARAACEKFEEYLFRYPRGLKAKDARHYLNEAREFLAQQDYEVAQFYLRQKRPKSALIYFRCIAREYPGTVWSEKAQDAINALEKEAK